MFSQKRNKKTNIRLIAFPFIICLLLVLLQGLVNRELDKPSNRCGCRETDSNGDGQTERECGIQYSTLAQVATCPIPSPLEWPPLLQIPSPEYRAVKTDTHLFSGLPNASCRTDGSCPATFLFTGANQTLGQGLPILYPLF